MVGIVLGVVERAYFGERWQGRGGGLGTSRRGYGFGKGSFVAASIAFEVWKCVDRSAGGVVVGFVLGIFPPSSLARSLAIPYIFSSLIFFFLFKCDLSTIPSLEASRDRSFILLSSFLCSYSVPSFICIPSFLSSFLSGRNRSSCFLPSFVHTPFLPLCAFVPSFLHIPSFPGSACSSCFLPYFLHTPFLPLYAIFPFFLHISSFLRTVHQSPGKEV